MAHAKRPQPANLQPPTRRDRKKAAVRKRLYDASLRLFRQRGYEQTTVQDIVDLADTAKGTFFLYFPSKEHVLLAHHLEMGRQILTTIRARTYGSAEEAVQDALRECAAWALDDPTIGRIIVRILFGSDLLMDSDASNEAQLSAWLHERIAEGRKRGELKRSLDIPLFVSLLIGTLSSTVTEWVSGNTSFDLEGRLEKKIRFLFGAARAS